MQTFVGLGMFAVFLLGLGCYWAYLRVDEVRCVSYVRGLVKQLEDLVRRTGSEA